VLAKPFVDLSQGLRPPAVVVDWLAGRLERVDALLDLYDERATMAVRLRGHRFGRPSFACGLLAPELKSAGCDMKNRERTLLQKLPFSSEQRCRQGVRLWLIRVTMLSHCRFSDAG